MLVNWPPNFGRDALRKRRPAPRRKIIDWLFGGGPPDEGELLARLDQVAAEIDRAIASGDTYTLDNIDFELRDGSPFDSPTVQMRVDELLARIADALDE